MFDVLFPKVGDNQYLGHKLAKWFLILLVLKSMAAGGIHMFAADGGAESIASIILSNLSKGGSDTVITLFALWGMEQFIIGLIGLVIVFRYQSLIPLMLGMYSIEYLMRKAMVWITPGMYTLHTPPGAVADSFLLPFCLIMFALAISSSIIRMKNKSNKSPH